MKRRINKNWIETYTEYASQQESPTLYHLWVALQTMAGATRRNIWVDQGYHNVYPNLYVMLVGPTAVKKNAAASIGADMLRAAYKLSGIPDSKIIYGRVTLPKLFDMMGTLTEKEGAAKEKENPTIVPLADVFLYAPELAVLLQAQDGQELISLLTEIWSCSTSFPIQYLTKNKGQNRLDNPCVNFLSCSTAEWLSKAINHDDFGGGFMGRIIAVVQHRNKRRVARPQVTPEMRATREALVEDLAYMTKVKGEMRLTSEADAMYIKWYEDLEARPEVPNEGILSPYLQRKPDQLLKVAMLLSLAKGDSMTISVDDLAYAFYVLGITEEMMKDAFRFIGTQESIIGEIMLQFVESKGGVVSQRELLRHVSGRLKDFSQFNGIVQMLEFQDKLQFNATDKIYELKKPVMKEPEEATS